MDEKKVCQSAGSQASLTVVGRRVQSHESGFHKMLIVVVYYCRTYMKAVRGGGVKRGDVCYGMLRAAACVDESDHHALMYVWHGQIVREDRVGEASARRP